MLFLIILILSFAASYILPWWMVAVVAFLAAIFIGKVPGKSFLSGFSAVFLVWAVLALLKSIPNEHMLASRVIQLFPLPDNWIWVLIVTAFIGGLVGGMAALSGALLRQAYKK